MVGMVLGWFKCVAFIVLFIFKLLYWGMGFPSGSVVKSPSANAGDGFDP